MGYLFAILILLSLTLTITYFSKKRFEECIAPSIFLVVLLLYIGGLMGFLTTAYLAVTGISLVSAISIIVFSIIKNKKCTFENFFTPALLVFVIAAFWIFKFTENRLLNSWDEFSHWGLVVKNMYHFDALGTIADATTKFKGYPPGISLFQYFFVKGMPEFIEANLFRAVDIFIISLFMPVLKNINWRNFGYLLLVVPILILAPTVFFGNVYTLIYVDFALGAVLAYIMYTWLSLVDPDKYDFMFIFSAVFMLCLIKASGTGIAIIAIALMAAEIMIVRKNLISKKKLGIGILIGALIIIISNKSWDIYLKANELKVAWDISQINFSNLISFFTFNLKGYQIDTIKSFISAVFIPRGDALIKFSYFGWMIIFAILGGVLFCQDKKYLFRRAKLKDLIKSFMFYTFGNWIGLILYMISLLALYVFTYSEYEATILASFDRYMASFFSGIWIFLIMMLVTNIFYFGKKAQKVSFSIITACVVLISPTMTLFESTVDYTASVENTKMLRAQYMSFDSMVKNMDKKQDKVYFIAQNTTGWEYFVSYYIATPVKISPNAYSLGNPYYDADIWSRNISLDEWKNTLKDYTYVYIHKVDDRFIERYGSIFSDISTIKDQKLYKVNVSDNNICLTPVDAA